MLKIIVTFILLVFAIAYILYGLDNRYDGFWQIGLVLTLAAVILNSVVINLPGYVTVKEKNGKYEVTEKTVDFKLPFVQKSTKVYCGLKDQYLHVKVNGTEYDITVTSQIDRDKAAWVAKNVPKMQYVNLVGIVRANMAESAVENCINTDGSLEDAVAANLQDKLDKKYEKDVFTVKSVVINKKGEVDEKTWQE